MLVQERRLNYQIIQNKSGYENQIHSIKFDYLRDTRLKNKKIENLELELGRAKRLLNKDRVEKAVQFNVLEDMESVVETKVI